MKCVEKYVFFFMNVCVGFLMCIDSCVFVLLMFVVFGLYLSSRVSDVVIFGFFCCVSLSMFIWCR